MIRFQTLGTLDLRDSQGRECRSVLRRPKLLALLGYLATARPRGFHRRDTLVALLWPDLDRAHARSALRQALHYLREALGPDALVTRGEEELGVNEERLWCDVRELETAVEAGQAETSLELYRGTLLSGVYVSGAPEFERWLDQEREHVRRRAVEAAQLLIDRENAAGNPVGAARWALRLTELSPEDETAVRRLMQLLDRSGDRAGAVRAYEEFERRLARDLDLAPSPETRALAESIRARLQPKGAPAVAPPGLATGRESGVEAATGAGSALAASATDGDIDLARSDNDRAAGARRSSVARKRAAGMLALAAGGLLTGGWFVFQAEFGARSAETAPEPKRLVVLPFTNLGPADEEYFADGIAEEITARLAAIGDLRVIGSTSAHVYKGTNKGIPEIGRELGVDYVLEGSIRWQKSAQGHARVRVTPQLVSTADGTHLWAQVYDEPLDEIFRVQSDIAQRVVRALDVTLLKPQRRAVEAVPTRNLEAYDYYLRANDYARQGTEERRMRTAVRMYEKAVEVDPRFALAYARLSRAHSRMYLLHWDRSQNRLAQAKRAVDRAFELEPDLREAHHSLGTYYFIGHLDYDRALREFAIAAEGRPNDQNVILARAVLRQRQGDFRESLADFERAVQLNPAAFQLANLYAQAHDLLRDFGRAEPLYDRAISLAPDQSFPYFWKTGLYLRWDGSTQKARRVLDEAASVGIADLPLMFYTRVLVEVVDRRYQDAIDVLSSGAPEVIADQFRFIPKAELLAQVYGLMQMHDLERAYYDSARSVVSSKQHEQPDDPRLHSALGIAYAGLGRKQEAIQEGETAVELLPIHTEAWRGYYRALDLARIYTMVGEHDAAVELLEHLLSIPGHLTAAWLRIDPTWDPLRGHPRFEALLRQAV